MMGVDPNVDPDLYEAIQMSLREDQERNAAAAAAAAAAAGGSGGAATPAPNNNNNNATPSAPSKSLEPGGAAPMDLGDDMDEEMRSAIALSMQMQAGGGGDELYKDMPPLKNEEGASLLQHTDKDDDEALKLSLALAEQSQKEDAVKAALNNQDYVRGLFGDLPVDLDDAAIQAALESITKGSPAPAKDEDGKPSDPKKKKEGQ